MIYNFLSIIYKFSQQVRVFEPGKLFQASLMFAGKNRSLPQRGGLSRLGPYPQNFSFIDQFSNMGSQPMAKLNDNKRSNVLGPMLYNFFVYNLQIIVVSQYVCTWQAFSGLSNVRGQDQEPILGASLVQAQALPSNFSFIAQSNTMVSQPMANTLTIYEVTYWAQCYTTFLSVIYKFSQQVRLFVPGKLFQACLMFAGKTRSLPQHGGSFRLGPYPQNFSFIDQFSNMGSQPMANTKTIYEVTYRAQCYTTFLFIIYKLSQ